MSSGQVLSAMLQRSRAALRADGLGLLAGHGVADHVYRPPHLPYASLVGPLNLETESERELPTQVVRVRTPGYLAGAGLLATDLVPPAGDIGLLLDGAASATVRLDFGARALTPITSPGTGAAVASTMQAAIRTAVGAGAFSESGTPVIDPARVAELTAVTVRWDRVRQRLVISSGRRGPVTGALRTGVASSVATVALPANDVAPALGLAAGALATPGRITRSRDTPPTAVGIDVRLDLWAGTQTELARLLDAWCAATPTRSELLLDPTSLATDVAAGDTSVRLLFGVLPRTPTTVVAASASGGFTDRISGRAPELDGAQITAGALTLSGNETATFLAVGVRPVAEAWRPAPHGVRGWSAELDLHVRTPADPGDSGQVLRLAYGATTVLRLDLTREGADHYRLHATGERADGQDFSPATVNLSAAALEAASAVHVHVAVDAVAGTLRLFADGAVPQPGGTPSPGPAAAGVDEDVVLTLGDPGGSDLEIGISELQLDSRPLGPADSRLRRAGPAAAWWTPGDPLVLAHSSDGYSAAGPSFTGFVLAVEDDLVHLDRPVVGDFPRGESIAHGGRLFMAQRQLRRNDDLMNRLYRVAFEYRVSAFLDDTRSAVSAPAVERPEVELRDLARLRAEEADPLAPAYPPRPAAQSVGISTRITSPRPPTHSGSGSSGTRPIHP